MAIIKATLAGREYFGFAHDFAVKAERYDDRSGCYALKRRQAEFLGLSETTLNNPDVHTDDGLVQVYEGYAREF